MLRTKWSQDVTPAVRQVSFTVEPRHFGPCGGNCFLVNLNVSAKKTAGGYRFRQICHTEGKSDLVVDAPNRSLVLRNVRIEPRCKGLLGSVVNFLGPFFTKSYNDITLFQMPAGLPFTVESVGSTAGSVSIAGKVAWSATPSVAISAKEARP